MKKVEFKVKDVKEAKEVGKKSISIDVQSSKKQVDTSAHINYLIKKYQEGNERAGTACVKGRGEVSGGGAKPYRQKGTGRARRGTNRTPLRVGGSVIFGPKPRSFASKLNKGLVRSGFQTVIAAKADSVSVVTLGEGQKLKAKDVVDFLKKEDVSLNTPIMLVVGPDDSDIELELGFRNLRNCSIASVNNIPLDFLVNSGKVYLTESCVKNLEAGK